MGRDPQDIVTRYRRHLDRLGILEGTRLTREQADETVQIYVGSSDEERPLLLLDTSVVGKGARGLMMTRTALYSRRWRGGIATVRFADIESVACDVKKAAGTVAWSDLKVNGRDFHRVFGRRRVRSLHVLADIVREAAGIATSSLSTGWWPVPTGKQET